MKLGEALSLRADRQRRVEQLRARITANATYQEGAEPAEDASALLAEADEVLDELETLIRRINRTNSATALASGSDGAGSDRSGAGTVTDGLARRDALRLRHAVLVAAADAASGHQHGVFRQLRSELRQVSALPVADLRTRADGVAREIRELDARLQQANWTVELVD